MNDLSVHLRYHTTASLGHIQDEFKHDPSDTSPGWFVEADSDEGYKRNRKLTRVTLEAAVRIAEAVDAECNGPAFVTNSVVAQNETHVRERADREKRLRADLERVQVQLLQIERERDDA